MLVDFAAADELPVFDGTEQPETCRKCGARTDFDEIGGSQQLHQCLRCAKRYLVEFEEELPEPVMVS